MDNEELKINSQFSTLNSQLNNGDWIMNNERHSQFSTLNSPLKKNIVRDKSFAFALRIVKLSKFLQFEKKEYVLSRQILRSGTAIGALIREAEHAQSKADFINKMSIALKEANETDYWIELLHQSNEIDDPSYDSIQPEIQELIKLLVSIVKTSKENKHGK